MPEQMTGAQMVLRALSDQGVEHIFGYPGGAVLPIYDEIFQQERVKHILVRHEQGAGHAAEGYARSTGKAGVALVTSGPGATNMVTPLTDAMMDSIPLVCITGQVPTHLIGNDAFQECDTVGITRPCTKHNWLVKDVNDLARVLHEAFYVATTGPARPGGGRHPEGRAIRDRHISRVRGGPPRSPGLSSAAARAGRGDRARRRTDGASGAAVLYTGGGVVNSGPGATQLLRELVAETGLSDHLHLMGLGAYPASGDNWLGHARHARHLRSQHGHARLRPDDLHRRPL
jgi:acetolactate synthase-1/2/3 large subunit